MADILGILDPRQRKTEIERQIRKCDSLIKSANASYDSLNRFKGAVENSQADFCSINGRTSQVLEPLSELSAGNTVISKYYCGMRNSLDSVGMHIVEAALSVLIGMIVVEKGGYASKSAWYETEKMRLEVAKTEAEIEICAMEKLQEW